MSEPWKKRLEDYHLQTAQYPGSLAHDIGIALARLHAVEAQVAEWRDTIRETGYDGAQEIVGGLLCSRSEVAKLRATVKRAESRKEFLEAEVNNFVKLVDMAARERDAALAQVDELQEKVEKLYTYYCHGEVFSTHDMVRIMAPAVRALLDDYHYDGHGHETLLYAVQAAESMLALWDNQQEIKDA